MNGIGTPIGFRGAAFDQALLRQPVDWAPIVRAAWVCALYAVPSLVAAFLVFLRRDVGGG